MRRLLLLPLLVGCPEPTPTGPSGLCPELDTPVVELSQGEDWGIEDGTPVQFGTPPQGGAPYAPFDVRLIGMPASTDGYEVVTEARLLDGTLVGSGEYTQRFVCANVGDNEGTRFASEFHMRFFGYEPDELADEDVEVEVRVAPLDGEAVIAAFGGRLDWVLGPMPDLE